jgi:iron complex transport system substrate-binding protein
MDARQKRLTLLFIVVVLVGGLVASAPDQQPGSSARPAPARRIVSLVPALTEMLFAIGAGPQVVAVSSFDDFPPEVTSLPRVGALLDPDVERILTLRPDLVITYGSQGSVEAQLARAGIRTFSHRHGGVQAIVQTLRDLGTITGRASQAEGRAREIEARLDAIRSAVRGYARPRVLLVFGRQPQSLRQMYASGGVGFLNDILEAAGGANVFADLEQESVQPSQETLLARAPDVIIEIRSGRADAATDVLGERSAWSPLASIPAVRQGRIHFLSGAQYVVPGPRVGLAAEQIARTLHPQAFRAGRPD